MLHEVAVVAMANRWQSRREHISIRRSHIYRWVNKKSGEKYDEMMCGTGDVERCRET